ncbi:MAG: VOC family protein [Pseudomonadota bacterium]
MSQAPQNALNWFEIPTRNLDRAEAFYGQVLDKPLRRETMGSAQMVMFPSSQEGVGGCLFAGPDALEPSAQGTVVYLNAEPSLNAALARVEKAGGKVVVPRTELPDGMGAFALFLDLDGNRVGLHAMQ